MNGQGREGQKGGHEGSDVFFYLLLVYGRRGQVQNRTNRPFLSSNCHRSLSQVKDDVYHSERNVKCIKFIVVTQGIKNARKTMT